MSRRCLLLAQRNTLKTILSAFFTPQVIDYKFCEVMPDGKPVPRAGKMFWAVHPGPRRNTCQGSLDELYDVSITLTMRCNEPGDRIGTDLLELAAMGLDDLSDVTRQLDMSYTVMNAANTLILTAVNAAGGSGTVYGFSEPLRFLNDDPPRFVGADWFRSKAGATELGVARTFNFGGARRLQPNNNIR